MAKKISELSREELQQVYDNNSKLQYEVFDRYQDDQMFWISEMLEYLKPALSDWSIGFNQHNYIKVKDFERLLSGIEDLQKDMCFFPDKNAHIVTDVKKAMQEYDKKQNDDIERDMSEWDKIESDYEEKQTDFINEIVSQFDRCVSYSLSDIEDYFHEFYVDQLNDESFYIDDDFILYENVAYEKSYK